ncbi:MAG: hypothetical protein CMJ72_07195 [Planctomycetaceae bacterium]|nr:hypothetical protein [Planctomycetaceae bacterium]
MKSYPRYLKRAVDLVVALTMFVLLAPLLLLIAGFVWKWSGLPILYRQERIGKGNRRFQMLKFRTMSDQRDRAGELLPDAFRLSRFGRFLRASSLDELPELWNVLRGDMSLVGPRPLLVEYLDLYTKEQAKRHLVLPGITGLAQVKGRNAMSWEQKFEYDVQYTEQISLLLDIRILFQTFTTVFKRQGISADGHATMPKFTGSKEDGLRRKSA